LPATSNNQQSLRSLPQLLLRGPAGRAAVAADHLLRIGIYSKIAVIFLGAFFSIAINSMAGICSVAGSGVVPTALLQRNERRFDAWRPSN